MTSLRKSWNLCEDELSQHTFATLAFHLLHESSSQLILQDALPKYIAIC